MSQLYDRYAAELHIQGAETMSHEIGQLDIPDRRLWTTSAKPRTNVWTEIGEAQITHTIFGRAKVRIIRKHDNIRRALWLVTMAVATLLAAAAWQGRVANQQIEPLQSADPVLPLISTVQESAPATQPEAIPMPAPALSVKSEPVTPAPSAIDKPAISRQIAPQQPQVLNGTGQMSAKPVPDKPLLASKPQPVPLATTDIAPKSPTDTQPSVKPTPRKRPAAAVAAPRATVPAANVPADVAQPVVPLVKENSPPQLPAGENNPAEAVSEQP
jgi:hypothetical protein